MGTYKSQIEWTVFNGKVSVIVVNFPLINFNSRFLDILRAQNTELDSIYLLLGLTRIIRFQIWIVKESDLFHLYFLKINLNNFDF